MEFIDMNVLLNKIEFLDKDVLLEKLTNKKKNLLVDSPYRTQPFKLSIPTISYLDRFTRGKYDYFKLEIYLGPVNIVFDEEQNEKEKDNIEPADSKNNIKPNSIKIIGENVILKDVPGSVKTLEEKEYKTQQVILSFNSAAFRLFKLEFLENLEIESRLQTWISYYFTYSEIPIEYSLGEVVLNDNTINMLQPESFSFVTNNGVKVSRIRDENNPKNIWILQLDEDWTFSNETVTVRSGTQILGIGNVSNVIELHYQNDILIKSGSKFRAESSLETLNLHIREN
ncbi:26485_t:CDS:2 [Gigaspora margarita]|uniref:26485_t:CDS:1 n=1 Tax=Gigaspora margarita TaxID=4874 RepID=A0ABN7V7A5_GIGMA|nr:26485_t:CDS:2 [Gigaspora margarita]